MAKNKMGEQTKAKILHAAKDLFVEKGYDNAKVDDIAAKANVTKTMLYYHYSSKENMLDEIIYTTVTEATRKFEENLGDIHELGKEAFEKHIQEMTKYWYDHKEIIKLVLLRMLKNDSAGAGLLGALNGFYEKISNLYRKTSGNENDFDKSEVKLFFYNTIPMMIYPLFIDSFISNSKLEREFIEGEFIKTFTRIFYENIK